MGAAKRRGTFEQRKAQKLATQFGLTNKQFEEAYHMNKVITLHRLYGGSRFTQFANIMSLINAYPFNYEGQRRL